MSTPGTWTHAAEAGWKFPISREVLAQWDNNEIIANQNRKAGAKYETIYERPWPDKNKASKVAGTAVDEKTAEELYGI